MKVLITGASGLLGTYLKKLNVDHDLVLADRQMIDISNANSVNKIISIYPNVIINAAAMTNVDLCETSKDKCYFDNYIGVTNLIKAAQICNAHIVHISTDFIFDGKYGPLDETAKPNPINYYGACKLLAEDALISSKSSFTILRTTLVYDNFKKNIVTWIKNSLINNEKINLIVDQYRTPTHAFDLATACN